MHVADVALQVHQLVVAQQCHDFCPHLRRLLLQPLEQSNDLQPSRLSIHNVARLHERHVALFGHPAPLVIHQPREP
eukprot:scaffold1978_cov381-Prasinococcus_capsulatus_cf.AAC.20